MEMLILGEKLYEDYLIIFILFQALCFIWIEILKY